MGTQEVSFRILRFNSEQSVKSNYQTFRIKIDDRMTVLDALEAIKHEQDASLTFRRSCRSGICGSCAMRINGLAKLACKTRAGTEADRYGEVLVEPMTNMMPVIRDLVVDMSEFWKAISRGTPWLISNETPEESLKENIITNEQQRIPAKMADCIMCGCCFSDCVSRIFDKNFNGPASLAKVNRFVTDPRDKEGTNRVHGLVEIGLWSCTHCYFCWSQCPRDVRPVAAISDLRVLSCRSLDPSHGARHVNALINSIRGGGMLNEATLYLRTLRLSAIKDIDLVLKMAVRGKAPSLFRKPIPRIEEVRTLYGLAGGVDEE
jgi:succinate dehydrogenase / fumarate reductase iron-sulfur subunit